MMVGVRVNTYTIVVVDAADDYTTMLLGTDDTLARCYCSRVCRLLMLRRLPLSLNL